MTGTTFYYFKAWNLFINRKTVHVEIVERKTNILKSIHRCRETMEEEIIFKINKCHHHINHIMDLFIQYYFGILSTTAQFHNQFSDVVEIDHSSGASNETMQ